MKRSFSPRSLPARSSPLAAQCSCRWKNTVVGSIFFTIGLFVVCTRGLHLFTGKVCYVFDNDMAYAKTLPVIWLGNLAGTSLIALAEKCTRLVSLSARAQGICELKLSSRCSARSSSPFSAT